MVGFYAGFLHRFVSCLQWILQSWNCTKVLSGFNWQVIIIVLKVCSSYHILDFVIRCHCFASYFVVLEYLIVGHLGFRTFGTLQRKVIIIVELRL